MIKKLKEIQKKYDVENLLEDVTNILVNKLNQDELEKVIKLIDYGTELESLILKEGK